MSSHESAGAGQASPAQFFGNQRFELKGCLGEGAWGIVYSAYDRLRGAQVALKVLRRLGPDALFYFKREFRTLADIRHRNLVRYQELFEEDGRWFFTMELVQGESLVEHARAGRSVFDQTQPCFDERRLRASLAQLVSALACIHAARKVHRDIKPSNVRITAGGRLVLLDFGLVLEVDAGESARALQVGTAAFMAPEQIAGGQVGPAADFYALGCVLYECLTGRHPFVGEPYDVLADKQTRDPPRPSEITRHVPVDLDELCRALLAREPEQRASGIEALRELAPPPFPSRASPSLSHAAYEPSFVGRARELTLLFGMLAATHEGHTRTVYVHGEAGIGKSALLAEFVRRVRRERRDAVILNGRCYERETLPFKAFDGVVDALARYLKALPDGRVERLLPARAELLPRFFPVLDRVGPIRSLRHSDPDPSGHVAASKRSACVALRELLERLGDQVPLLIVIDDVHWADAESLALLSELLAAGELPALVVLAGAGELRASNESPPTDRGLVPILASARATPLPLGLLSEAESRALAARQLPPGLANPELVRIIAQEGLGSPLFVSTLTRFAAERPLGGAPTLEAALAAQATALSEPARLAGMTLAVAGQPVSRGVLSGATALDAAALAAALDELLSTRWVNESVGERDTPLQLAHARVRDVLLARLREGERQRLHLRLAEALARAGAEPEAAVGHWLAAGAHAEAVGFACWAAQSASRAGAFDRAVRLYELAHAYVIDTDPVRDEIALGRADALSRAGRARDAAQGYWALAVRREGVPALLLRHRAASELLAAGEHERATSEARSILEQLSTGLPGSHTELARSYLFGRLKGFWQGYRPGRRPGEAIDDRGRLEVDVLWSLVTALAADGTLERADIELRHLSAALSLGDPYRLSRAFAIHAWRVPGAKSGDELLASPELAHAHELALQSGHPHALALVELVSGIGHHASGRYMEAEQFAASAVRLLREQCNAVPWELSQARMLEQSCALDAGAWSKLRGMLGADARAQPDARASPALSSRFLVWERLLGDQPEVARSLLEQVRERIPARGVALERFELACAQTEIDLYVGDPSAFARIRQALSEPGCARLLAAPALRLRAWFLGGRAAVRCTRLLGHLRPRLLREARRFAFKLQHERARPARALGGLLEACVADVSGERARATRLFEQAARACDESGLPQYAAAARRGLGGLLGGEEGRALMVSAEHQLRERGALDPGRLCGLLLGY